jgi:hypothetical protein
MTSRWMTRSRPGGPPRGASGPAFPDDVRHREKWRLALKMIDEICAPEEWGILERPPLDAAGRWW